MDGAVFREPLCPSARLTRCDARSHAAGGRLWRTAVARCTNHSETGSPSGAGEGRRSASAPRASRYPLRTGQICTRNQRHRPCLASAQGRSRVRVHEHTYIPTSGRPARRRVPLAACIGRSRHRAAAPGSTVPRSSTSQGGVFQRRCGRGSHRSPDAARAAALRCASLHQCDRGRAIWGQLGRLQRRVVASTLSRAVTIADSTLRLVVLPAAQPRMVS